MQNPVIDQALIKKIAKLAALELSDAEKVLFTEQFKSILGIVRQVQEADTGDVVRESTATLPLRKDEPVQSNIDVADFSPHVENGFFKAPKIL